MHRVYGARVRQSLRGLNGGYNTRYLSETARGGVYNYHQRLPTREEMVSKLSSGEEFDMIIVGGGATGAGAALDAASRGLKVACIEREDFSSGTSSRSSKLLWGGSRYLVNALMELFSPKLLFEPRATVKSFLGTFHMVKNCIHERQLLLEKQSHLTWWIPLAVYHEKWFSWPPPFGYPPAAFGPLGVYALFFKFYDALSNFRAPPSHIMTKARAQRKFPHLDTSRLKYCSVFYEGMHDDARTNLAIAQTASMYGADIANYLDVTSLLREEGEEGEVNGVRVKDAITQKEFTIHGKSVLFCGGPFTDELRAMENEKKKKVVKGASGVHIVLPGYYAPSGMGMVDMNTSDGRFLFFLPWHDHVVVGTTDRPAEASMRPEPTETEIKWILNEASKYLNPELVCRRSDVLSAWCGVRPLAEDPSADEGGGASRDHVLHFDEESGVTWISGGKWTTYREMAEDAVDKVIEKRNLAAACTLSTKSKSKEIPLIGNHGFSNLLPVRLVQEYGIAESIARRLSRAYGGRAFDVMRIEREELGRSAGRGVRLTPGYPILEAEVIFAARHDWAVTVEDFLARRTRLAYLNKDVALSCIPRIAGVMQRELQWTEDQKNHQISQALAFLDTFGGDKPKRDARSARLASPSDILDAFALVTESNPDLNGVIPETLDRRGISIVSNVLDFPLEEAELDACFKGRNKDNRMTVKEFETWFNSDDLNPHLETFRQSMSRGSEIKGSGAAFS